MAPTPDGPLDDKVEDNISVVDGNAGFWHLAEDHCGAWKVKCTVGLDSLRCCCFQDRQAYLMGMGYGKSSHLSSIP